MTELLRRLGLSGNPPGVAIARTMQDGEGSLQRLTSPLDGSILASVRLSSIGQCDAAISAAADAFLAWRAVPAPRRGELVRRIGNRVRERKDDLAALITREVGKIPAEAQGEVQEWIDMCDFAVGLSRQLHGLTIASERPGHRMMEQWHPLGPVAVITAFNFPMAVWAWNAMLALICGDSVVWKPSEKALLCALSVQHLVHEVLADFPDAPPGLLGLVPGARDIGMRLAASPQMSLVSATGSTRMGREVAVSVAGRLGRSLLELGGNNALILTPSGDLELALRAIVFAAVGTCGQRCTSLRRLIVHRSLMETVRSRLLAIYARLPIGNPATTAVLVGPLIDRAAAAAMEQALQRARSEGGVVHCGGVIAQEPAGTYVRPALVTIDPGAGIVAEETFAPILYLLPYDSLEEAIRIHNAVPQGLSSAMVTSDLIEAERFLGPAGSDCGIANINIGTSGAEIGGAFGGEKTTGGGRESGSDAWKSYMRRTTNTINFTHALPLAQGVDFSL
jgi:aldehyde dehydrogenase (NAD+)